MELYKTFQKAPIMKSVAVYEQMKEELINGKWSFGEKILVNDLIKKFNVSRRPVMDAMKMLESDGFIEIVPQSGCKVVDYSKKNVIDLLLLTSSLESLCAELAAINHTIEEIESLEDYQNQVARNSEKLSDKTYYFRYNREFHFRVSLMTHSDLIRNHAMQIWDINDFYLSNLFEQYRFDARESLDYHGKIIHFIKIRDKLNAKRLMEEHLHSYIKKLMDQLP
jgi:DNA-binding GntR family transcriptional regulator